MISDIIGGLLLAFWFSVMAWQIYSIGYDIGERKGREKRDAEIKNQLN